MTAETDDEFPETMIDAIVQLTCVVDDALSRIEDALLLIVKELNR